MSRPCFALSVMLCCMAGPLLAIGKAHARDAVVPPRHDPGECITCPLVYSPYAICGGYSDYDYNQYWHDVPPTDTLEQTTQSDPELEVAQTLTDDSASGTWAAEYEDYYADYVFGDDSTATNDADLTLEETPNLVAPLEDASETVSAPEGNASDAYFDSYDSYEPIGTTEENTTPVAELIPADPSVDYEAYEEEWFAYGSETTVESNPTVDEAYEALAESERESDSDDMSAASAADESWGDEEEWYREQTGYEDQLDEQAEDLATSAKAEQLETGYDESYDDAMTNQPEAAEPVAEISPPVDNYEPFYDAYDDLYNFEAAALESSKYESSEAGIEPSAEESAVQTSLSESAWLTDLVTRLLEPVWTTTGSIASEDWTFVPLTQTTINEDGCAQAWNCEVDYWAQPQNDQPSLALEAADTLDGVASLLRDAAEALRGLAQQDIAEMARKTGAGSAR